VSNTANLQRDEVTLADGQSVRFYYDPTPLQRGSVEPDLDGATPTGDGVETGPYTDVPEWVALLGTPDGTIAPSVTTITDMRDDEGKRIGLKKWRELYDGHDEDSRPHWRDQRAFKRLRGTTAHYITLSSYGELPETDEERDARDKLQNWWAWRPSAYDGHTNETLPDGYFSANAVVRTVGDTDHAQRVYEAASTYWRHRRNGASHGEAFRKTSPVPQLKPWIGDDGRTTQEYVAKDAPDGTAPQDAWVLALQHSQQIAEQFHDHVRCGRVPSEDIVGIEEYVLDTDVGYAGQYDLATRDADGNVHIVDLKTNGVVRDSPKYQLAAYARACPYDVENVWVVSSSPYDGVTVESDAEWAHDWAWYAQEFVSLANEVQAEIVTAARDTYNVSV